MYSAQVLPADLSISTFPPIFPSCSFSSPTFSSLVATLKASSVTLPAAQRAALEECSSFQMVSLSTYEQGDQSDGDGAQDVSPWGPRLGLGAEVPSRAPWATSRAMGRVPWQLVHQPQPHTEHLPLHPGGWKE